MRRFQKAKEFIQSDKFGNVIDFFQATGKIGGGGGGSGSGSNVVERIQKKDYTPLYILGAIAVLVAVIKK